VRAHGPTTLIRITTKEQTLIDTLYKPLHCGGPEVVFEAWDEGMGALDEERLANYLQLMNYPATTRRVGALLESRAYQPGVELLRVLRHAQESIDRRHPFVRISLLPGMPYTTLDSAWMVDFP
jgi:predicted transcriptional regulator of viral defense system